MTGSGNAGKEQVKKMVILTVDLEKTDLPAQTGRLDDEIDAIALGVAALQTLHLKNLEKGLVR